MTSLMAVRASSRACGRPKRAARYGSSAWDRSLTAHGSTRISDWYNQTPTSERSSRFGSGSTAAMMTNMVPDMAGRTIDAGPLTGAQHCWIIEIMSSVMKEKVNAGFRSCHGWNTGLIAPYRLVLVPSDAPELAMLKRFRIRTIVTVGTG